MSEHNHNQNRQPNKCNDEQGQRRESERLQLLKQLLDTNQAQLNEQQLMERKLMLLAGISESASSSLPFVTPSINPKWSLSRPHCSNSSILARRVCFVHKDQFYLPSDQIGSYISVQHNPDLLEHIEYTSLPLHIKPLITRHFGQKLPHFWPDACYRDVACVGRNEFVDIAIKSRVVGAKEPHSGINIFGEPTLVSLCILDEEIGLANKALQQLIRAPEVETVFFANASNIYVVDGHTLLKSTNLGVHALPIKNIDLAPL